MAMTTQKFHLNKFNISKIDTQEWLCKPVKRCKLLGRRGFALDPTGVAYSTP